MNDGANPLAQFGEFGRGLDLARVAVARKGAHELEVEPSHDPSGPRRHDHEARTEKQRLLDRMGDEEDLLAGARPDVDQKLLHRLARHAVERAERLVHEEPPFGAVLTPRRLPTNGADTLWSSTVAAYEALSEPIRRLVDGLTAEHDFQHGFRRHLWGVGERKAAWEKAVAANPPVIHPVVRTIDEGRRGLFVNEGFTSRIIELTLKESEALLALLFAHIAKPEFTVRWRWKLGDVAFWDNRLSTHYATLDYLPQSREMARAAIIGDRPR